MLLGFFELKGKIVIDTHKRLHNLNNDDIKTLTRAYVEYLLIKILYGDTGEEKMSFSASPEVDQLWHTNILCTQVYFQLMEVATQLNPDVTFIHHSMSLAADCEEEKERRRAATRKAYEEIFHSPCSWIQTVAQKLQENDTIAEGHMKITVKTLRGEIFHFILSKRSSVIRLKVACQDKIGIPVDQQRLIYAGRQLDDEKLLFEHGVTHGAVLEMVLRLVGC